MKFLTILLSLGISISVFAEKMVNRKVLILDFVNQQSVKKGDYLAITIPEAYIDPLKKTGSFEVMSRHIGQREAGMLGYDKSQLYNENTAVAIGKKADAEVVVIGNYVIVAGSIQIQAKAVDVLSERIKVSKSKVGKLDASIFATIKSLAEEMSAEMKQELPPIPQREIMVGGGGDSILDGFYIDGNVALGIPIITRFGEVYKPAIFTFSGHIGKGIFFVGPVFLGLDSQFSFTKHESRSDYKTKLKLTALAVTGGASVNYPAFALLKGLQFHLRLMGGFANSTLERDFDNRTFTTQDAVVTTVLDVQYRLVKGLYALLTNGYSITLYKGENFASLTTGLGVGYAF